MSKTKGAISRRNLLLSGSIASAGFLVANPNHC